MASDEELDELREKRMKQLHGRLSQEQQKAQLQQQIEMQKQALLRRILSTEARQRLTNLKMVRREFAEQIELQLIQLAQSGRLEIPLSDDQLKKILTQLQSKKRDIKIRRR